MMQGKNLSVTLIQKQIMSNYVIFVKKSNEYQTIMIVIIWNQLSTFVSNTNEELFLTFSPLSSSYLN